VIGIGSGSTIVYAVERLGEVFSFVLIYVRVFNLKKVQKLK
jgi:ribose 5-phosphate isomerase